MLVRTPSGLRLQAPQRRRRASYPSAAPPSRPLHPFLPEPGLCLSGLGGLGPSPRQWPSQWGRWRQLLCIVCRSYFLETLGTIFHGQRVVPELIVRVIACLAEGLGIRGTARVFEVDPNTVLQWLVEAAEHLQAFSRHFLHDLHVNQVQLDELFALLSAVQDRSQRVSGHRVPGAYAPVGVGRDGPRASCCWRSTSAIGPGR